MICDVILMIHCTIFLRRFFSVSPSYVKMRDQLLFLTPKVTPDLVSMKTKLRHSFKKKIYQSSDAFGNVQVYFGGGARELRFGVIVLLVRERLRLAELER